MCTTDGVEAEAVRLVEEHYDVQRVASGRRVANRLAPGPRYSSGMPIDRGLKNQASEFRTAGPTDNHHFSLELALPSSSSIRFNKSAVSCAFRWASTIETTL